MELKKTRARTRPAPHPAKVIPTPIPSLSPSDPLCPFQVEVVCAWLPQYPSSCLEADESPCTIDGESRWGRKA